MATKSAALKAKRKNCVHYWNVRPPDGATSWGECRLCGRRKRFSNHFEGRDRNTNSDIFSEPRDALKTGHRSPYGVPGADETVAGARLAGVSV